MSREEGFYWILTGDAVPIIAEWSNAKWWLTGIEVPILDADVPMVLSARLELPE